MEPLRLEKLFGVRKPVIAVIHAPPLPGAPEAADGMAELRERVVSDGDALRGGGVDGLLLENFGDAPFRPGRVAAHTVAHMAVLVRDLRERLDVPVGVNVLRNDGASALSVAAAAGGAFIRVNVYVGARLTDQGIVEGRAHRIVRLRRQLDARVRIFADLDVKHSAPLAERPVGDEAVEALRRGKADALVLTGPVTGVTVDEGALGEVKERLGEERLRAPLLVGSGVTAESVERILSASDGAIVGTALKRDGVVDAPVDPDRVEEFMEAARRARA